VSAPWILVTGFEPFPGFPVNPSAALLAHLPRAIAGHALRTAVLPVSVARVAAAIGRALDVTSEEASPLAPTPSLVLAMGVAARPTPTLERLAVNLLDFVGDDGHPRVDNDGLHVDEAEIEPGAPLALPTRLPVRALVTEARRAGLPLASSLSAGSYLCNQALFLLLRRLPAEVDVGFLHVVPEATCALEVQRAVVAQVLSGALTRRAARLGPPTV
jgi:pyroglutamyl-peptidase